VRGGNKGRGSRRRRVLQQAPGRRQGKENNITKNARIRIYSRTGVGEEGRFKKIPERCEKRRRGWPARRPGNSMTNTRKERGGKFKSGGD